MMIFANYSIIKCNQSTTYIEFKLNKENKSLAINNSKGQIPLFACIDIFQAILKSDNPHGFVRFYKRTSDYTIELIELTNRKLPYAAN